MCIDRTILQSKHSFNEFIVAFDHHVPMNIYMSADIRSLGRSQLDY